MEDLINEKAKIYNLDEFLLCEARFINVSDNIINLVYYTPIDVTLREHVIISLASDLNGIMMYRCSILEISELKTKIIKRQQYAGKFKIIELANSIQRRRDFKIRLWLPLKITMLDSNKDELLDPETEEQICFNVHLKDLSASGMLFATEDKFPTGQLFRADFSFVSPGFIIIGEILRTQQDFFERIGYGCRFIDSTSSKESLIRQYVFRQQIKQHKG